MSSSFSLTPGCTSAGSLLCESSLGGASLRFAPVGEGLEALAEEVSRAKAELGGEPRLLHYLSLPPNAQAGISTSTMVVGLIVRMDRMHAAKCCAP